MQTFFLKSLGCKTNQLEGQLIAQNLVDAGFAQVKKIDEADFYILNSCTVTKSADSQVFYLLNKAKRENPNVKTVLAGCLIQSLNGGRFENVDMILDNRQKLEISKYLSGNDASKADVRKDFKDVFLKKPTSTRVSIKIQEGCNNSCSYCIIPSARGASVSNKIENIVSQIENIEKLGHKEIVLTGIHIGQWGIEWDKSLIDLLKIIEGTKIHRYRLGSLYVNEIDDEMIEFLKKSEKFCPHFHLSLQSMCDKTLKAMNRNYSVKEALDLIEKLYKNFDLPFLGSDVIVGFPNESEADFIETYKNLEHARLSKIHVFPYSRRTGTLADRMEGQIKESIKKDRAKKLMELSEKLNCDFLEKNLGRELEIIYENKSQKNGLSKGVSGNYIEIYTKSDENLKGQMRKIILTKDMLK